MFSRLYNLATLQVLLALISPSFTHPGEKHDAIEARRDAETRHAIANINKATLIECSSEAETIGRKELAMKRRMETFQRLRKHRGIVDGTAMGKTKYACRCETPG